MATGQIDDRPGPLDLQNRRLAQLAPAVVGLLDQLKRPDVDFIHGLSPVLAIEQRTGNVSPRTTIATVSEVSDYSRLLWAVAGEQRCPKDGGRVVVRRR